MKTLFFKICLSLVALVLNVVMSNASNLASCPEIRHSTKSPWLNCFGTYTFADGNKYVGEFRDDKYNGQGTYTFADGNKYVGEFRDDKYNGQGTFTFADGHKYVGEFRDGKRNGQGTFTFADGHKYVGEFRDDKYNGQGTFTFADGNKYVGEFRDDKRNGQGYFIFAKGRAEFCTYIDNEVSNCSGSNVYDVAPILLQKFQSLTEYQRKRVQTNLRTRGLYSSSIDGKWSKNTFFGLASYSALNLKTININSSYQANRLLNAVLGNQTASTSKTCFSDPKLCENEQICIFAQTSKNGKKVWETSGNFTEHATEAKRRGLSCGVSSITATAPKQKTCEDDPKLCTVIQLCQKASTTKNGKKVWRNTDAAKSYISLAKGNGLTCNVKEEPEEEKILKVASGTGFFVSPQGHIVTNEHVIDGCTETKVHMKGKMYPSIMLAKDVKNDLALLQISNKPDTYFELNKGNPELLDDIFVAGYPFGNRLSSSLKITRGIVSSESGLADNFSEIQIDAALQPGNSGGPILNEYGNVVGVAVAKLDAEFALEEFGSLPENTNFGIKVSIVKSLLEANEVSFAEGGERRMANKALGKLAKDATVFLSCWMTTAQIEIMRKRKVLFEDLE
jgi:S1-C subfamily serine protease